MRALVAVLVVMVVGIGAIAVIALRRRPAAEDTRLAQVSGDIDRLSQEIRDLKEAVARTRAPMVIRVPESAPAAAPATAGVGGSLSATVAAADPLADTSAPTPADARDNLVAARRLVTDAERVGLWQPADRDQLRDLATRMRPEDLISVLKALSVEINSQRVRLTQGGPVF